MERTDMISRLEDAEEIDRSGRIEDALSAIYDMVDDMVDESRYDLMNDFLRTLNIEILSAEFLVMALSATLPHKDRLCYRAKFFEIVKEKLVTAGMFDEYILMGLN